MILRMIARLSLLIGCICGMLCLIAIIGGGFVPTTRVVAYVYDTKTRTTSFAVYDLSRKQYSTIPMQSAFFGDVLFSPNGKQVLLVSYPHLLAELRMIDFATHRQTLALLTHTNCSFSVGTMSWLQDNRHVLFQCIRSRTNSQTNEMYLWDTENNTMQHLYTPEIESYVLYQWTSDGRLLYALDNGMLWVIDIQNNTRHHLPDGLYSNLYLSPNGDYLALTSRRHAYIHDVKSQQTYPILPEHFVSDIFWSPDGEWLAIPVRENDIDAIYTQHIPTQAIYRIESPQGFNQATGIQWSDNSEYFVFQIVNPGISQSAILVATREGNGVYYVLRNNGTVKWIPNQLAITYNPVPQGNRYSLLRTDIDVVNPRSMHGYTLAENVIAYQWYEDRLFVVTSPDRYGQMKLLSSYPNVGEALFPQHFNVQQFSLWR